ncbi:MAG: VIT1/CCC1 family protein [Dongiaceae bacterium]
MAARDDVARYRANLQGEIDSASLYRALADAESDPQLAEVYRRLAAVESAHAEFWKKQLDRVGAQVGGLRVGWRSRALAWLSRRFGPGFVLPTINALEQSDSAQYDAQPEAVAAGLPGDERSHARVVRAVAGGLPGGLSGAAWVRLEGRHRTGGNALRAAVLGANDGLVSNLSLVMGVAGAEAAGQMILLTGLAGLVAGACSMAMGEWLSVTSARELAERQIDIERQELEQSPEEEKAELALIYQAKGLSQAEAERLAATLIGNKETALDTLAREELGIDPAELGGSPWTAGATSFGLFALGALVPVLPFFILDGTPAVLASLALGGLALVGIGAGTSLFTGRGVVLSAVRQLAIGLAAAAITWGIGRLVGVSLAG